MRLRAVYETNCLCGHAIESEEPKTVCPHCALTIFLEWGGQPAPAKAEEQEPLEKAKAKGAGA